MFNLTSFLKQLDNMKWFDKSGTPNEKYHIIYSLAEAYDDWNREMYDIWEPKVCELEKRAQELIGDDEIDQIFDSVAITIDYPLAKGYDLLVKRCELENDEQLKFEIMNFIKRDVAWAAVEQYIDEPGFFTNLLNIYKEGYFPCSWNGVYPQGKIVVV